jgi:hypothetical protein
VKDEITVVVDNEAFIVERGPDGWYVYRTGGRGELGRYDFHGRIFNVDQAGDWKANERLLERVRDAGNRQGR